MEKTVDDAKRRYLELYGGTLVMNTYLKVALLAVSIALLGMLGLSVSIILIGQRAKKPMVVRIDEVGRATAINNTGFTLIFPKLPSFDIFSPSLFNSTSLACLGRSKSDLESLCSFLTLQAITGRH